MNAALSPELVVAIDEAAEETVRRFRFLAEILDDMSDGNPVFQTRPGQSVEANTAEEAVETMVLLINNVPNFEAHTEDGPNGPAFIINYMMPELIAVEPDDSYSYKTILVETPYALKKGAQSTKTSLIKDLKKAYATIEPGFFRELLTETAKEELQAGKSFVSRREHLLSKLPAVFELTDTDMDNRSERIRKVRANDTVKLRISYKNFPFAAIEVLDESGESLGFLAEKNIPGFGEKALDDLAFLLYYDCIQARAVSVTPLSEQKNGAEITHMEVEIAAREQEDRK